MRRSRLLAVLLAAVAAYVDTCGFIALSGLFVAHVTGNFVLFGVSIATRSDADVAEALTVPVFLLVVGATCVLVHLLERAGRRPLVPVLVLEWLLLAAFLAAGLRWMPFPDPHGGLALVVGALGVAAMAVQNATMRRLLPELTATTVMTTVLTQVAVDATDLLLGGPRAEAARPRLGRMLPVVLAFGLGAVAAGVAYLAWGFACVAAPLVLLLAAILVAWRDAAGAAALARER